MELYLDIINNFSLEIKSTNATEYELINNSNHIQVYYLFTKLFFSIEGIIEASYNSFILFTYFMPEIKEHDPEHTQNIINEYLSYSHFDTNFEMHEFYLFVTQNPEKHIFYRKTFYNPSKLHKSIREDDIETFQSLLSKNNYGVNYRFKFSYYERKKPINKESSLLENAASYGSLKIFKFLWMQDNIIINDDLFDYAFLGGNLEIIHIVETKCNIILSFHQPILMHNFDFLGYCLDNYADNFYEYDDLYRNLFTFHNYYLNDKEGTSQCINYYCLRYVLFSHDFVLLPQCLQKIVLAVKYIEAVEFPMQIWYSNYSLLYESKFDIELFEFLFKQRKQGLNILNCKYYSDALILCLYNSANDAFKILFNELYKNIDIYDIFQISIENNHEIANYLLDIQIDGTNKFVFNQIKKRVNFYDIQIAISYYNEDIVIKMIQLYDLGGFPFVYNLRTYLSDKMILSLFDRLLDIVPPKTSSYLLKTFKRWKKKEISDFIKMKMKKTKNPSHRFWVLIFMFICSLFICFLKSVLVKNFC